MDVAMSQGVAARTAAPARGGVADGDARRTWQFTKTKLCKFHIVGMCVKGPNCAFAHEKDDLRPLPDLTCTKLCKKLIQTGSCEDESCTYAHTKDELRATSTFHKTKLCRFSQIGHCALGSKCNFAHSPDEVRPLESPLPQAASREAPQLQRASGEGLYSDQQLSEAHLLLQQQLALAQQQQQPGDGYMASFSGNQPHYFSGLGAPTLMPGAPQDTPFRGQEPVFRGPGPATHGGPGPRGKQTRGPAGMGAQLPMTSNPMVPPVPATAANMPQRRRNGRKGKDGPGGKGEKGAGKGRGKSLHEPEAMEPSGSQLASSFEAAGAPAMPGMTESEMAGFEAAGMAGNMSAMGPLSGMSGMPGLDWITRQGNQMPQMPDSQGASLAMPEAPYSGSHAASFSNAAAVQFASKRAEDLKGCPAYITQTTSDFVVKNTFLEFGAIGGPLRPVRSAAGRLDVLGGSGGNSSENLCDLAAVRSHGSAGSLSTMDRPDGGEYGSGETEYMSQAASRGGKGARYYDDADAAGSGSAGAAGDLAGGPGGSSTMLSDCTPQSGFGGSEGQGAVSWDETLFKGSFTINQTDDVWQVKNTFLTFTPQTKPIRSVRTAEGALCTLGALGDDEP